MSLDDESPTQYFGADGVTFTGPHGKPLRVSRDHYLRLTESGALTDEQMLNAVENGRSLQDILNEANHGANVPGMIEPAHHRVGCSHSRTGRCICAYLAQWDKHPEYTAPSFKLGELSLTAETMQVDRTTSDRPVPITAGTMSQEDAESLFKHPGHLVPRTISDPHDEDDTPWDLDEDAADWEEKNYYPVIDKPDLKALTVNGEIWEPRALRTNTEDSLAFWKGQAKHWQRSYWLMLGIAAVNGACLWVAIAKLVNP